MIRILKALIVVGLCYLIRCNQMHAQQIVQFDRKDGLINGTVNAFEVDSLGFMWIGTNQGLNRFSGVEFKNYKLNKKNKSTSEGVSDIININGDLYAISIEGSLLKYQYDLDSFKELLVINNKKFLSVTNVNNSHLVIGMSAGFIAYNIQKNTHQTFYPKELLNRKIVFQKEKIYSATPKGLKVFKFIQNQLVLEKKYLPNQDIIDFSVDDKQRLWVGTEAGGLYLFEKGNLKNIPIGNIANKTYAIRKISFDKNKNALIAIDRLGLFVLNEKFEITKSFSHNPNDDNTLSQNSIYEIFVDHTNSYWLGFRESGFNIIYEKNNIFSNISHIKNEVNCIDNNNIRSIFESSNGEIWFGTENGVSKYAKNGKWSNFNKDPKLYNTAVLAINQYKGKLLLGTYGEGLLQVDQNSGKTTPFDFEPKVPLKFIFSINVFNENVWIGGIDGPLVHYFEGTFVRNYSLGLVRTVIEGFDQIYYVGTSDGFFEINTRSGSYRKIKKEVFNSFNEVHHLNLDYVNNCIWIGSKNGFHKFSLGSEKLENVGSIAKKDIGTVFSMKKDNMQNLYLATISGLWRYDIKKKSFRKFNTQDGLLIDEFGFGASANLSEGKIAFGGPKGAVIFNPMELDKDENISDIFISNFQINGKEPDTVTLPKNINFTKKIVLNYDQNSISFNYEIVKFHGSKAYEFKWKLEGYDQDFLTNISNDKVEYSNLKPGKYTLKVQGFNADGIQGKNEYLLEIEIKKPFWRTFGAFGLYLLVAIVFIYLLYRIFRANIQNKIDESKIMFFVEVAHDIRTPVSLIQLLVKQLANQENVEKSMELIQRNTENLNEYVTQLLDFQKIERKQLKLTVTKVDLKECLGSIVNNFSPILKEKSLQLSMDIKQTPIWFDKAKMSRIFYNLISNAIKYSNEGGKIEIKTYLKDKFLHIDFIDNGIGVPEKQQELIFKRFTRGTNVTNKGIPGTGIGLMLSKKIIELHGGKILLESQENVGSKFTVVLPFGTEHFKEDEVQITEEVVEEKASVENLIVKNKLILLVEDNVELREAIKNELVKTYNVMEASNGKEGLLLALSKNPDLIITDVMMPEMEGKEFCNLIKTNFKTSHIPVIMLSALADIDDKIKGLENGADAYVEKPFNVDYLKVTIKNLIKSRENVKHLLEDKEVKKQLTPDESFLSDVIEVIKNNLTENDFTIDHLADIMGLSRSNLFRRLKGLIQISPSDLIIKIKLSHAEELMKSKKYNRISDIAYESGFQDPKYFSTLFKKHYGKTPTEFIEDN
jgi:signal transduction histidine kinase/DNA-binding response OmpR family regulator/ligand-binding sensor domain-containing protein